MNLYQQRLHNWGQANKANFERLLVEYLMKKTNIPAKKMPGKKGKKC